LHCIGARSASFEVARRTKRRQNRKKEIPLISWRSVL
jgi:hypothetical protein